ncbi:peptidylprolyl isomerase [Rhodobacterales bacterium HKCCE3408]|nr:peptidylprolyl isomerase [Rhodobacterales bacterium HKCCE3408]
MTKAAAAGDQLHVHYTGKLEDGTVFDTSEGRDPLVFTAGEGQIIPGLDDALIGMEVGQSKQVTVPPESAYGEHHADRVQQVPRDSIPDHIPTDPGTQLQMQTPDGQAIPVTVAKATDTHIELDANHPLAGKTLQFDVTLVEIG